MRRLRYMAQAPPKTAEEALTAMALHMHVKKTQPGHERPIKAAVAEKRDMGEAHYPACMVIIDDNPRSLEFIATALARPGLEIFTTTKPEDGLALVAMHHPKVVVTDVVMPGMSGLEVLRRVKQFDPAIDVVLMSAHLDGGGGPKTVPQATDYLSKPIALSVLRERIGRLLDEHIAQGQKP